MGKHIKPWLKIISGLALAFTLAAGFVYWRFTTRDGREPSLVAWNEHCAGCHGTAMKGNTTGPALVGVQLGHGDTVAEFEAVIANGIPGTAMVGWKDELSPQRIKSLALLISDRRQMFPSTAESYGKEPHGSRRVNSKYHAFRLERVATLESRPYSLAAMPNGEILVAEKARGLSLIGADGKQRQLLRDTPRVSEPFASIGGSWVNWGSVLDIALHPEFEKNGWI